MVVLRHRRKFQIKTKGRLCSLTAMSDYNIGKYESFSFDNEADRAAFWKVIYFNISGVSVKKEMKERNERKQGDMEVK